MQFSNIPSWPFSKNNLYPDTINPYTGTHRTDPTYYAGLPGAIRGQAPVIYYPSCAADAYYQPAIINYCAGYDPVRFGGRDLKDPTFDAMAKVVGLNSKFNKDSEPENISQEDSPSVLVEQVKAGA